jgi:hypothetical protein
MGERLGRKRKGKGKGRVERDIRIVDFARLAAFYLL